MTLGERVRELGPRIRGWGHELRPAIGIALEIARGEPRGRDVASVDRGQIGSLGVSAGEVRLDDPARLLDDVGDAPLDERERDLRRVRRVAYPPEDTRSR
jgi:hypothetical protein